MKLGVIGEPCIDYIHRGEKITTKHLGGILYAVVSLAVIAKDDEIYPIINLGEDEFDNVCGFLSRFKNIKPECINKSKHKTRIVNLFYGGAVTPDRPKTYDREESSTEPTEPVSFAVIDKTLPMLDGLLVNMVSGVDVTLDTFKQIRNNFDKYIHFDLHNLVMETRTDGQRLQRPISNWQDWCSIPDIIQMNESEINILTGEGLNEYETAEHILNDKRAMIVTRGMNGVSLYQKKMKTVSGETFSQIDKMELPAIERNDFKDSTGCGDVFSAGFFYKNLVHKGEDLHAALNYANKTASRKSALTGVEELYRLND